MGRATSRSQERVPESISGTGFEALDEQQPGPGRSVPQGDQIPIVGVGIPSTGISDCGELEHHDALGRPVTLNHLGCIPDDERPASVARLDLRGSSRILGIEGRVHDVEEHHNVSLRHDSHPRPSPTPAATVRLR